VIGFTFRVDGLQTVDRALATIGHVVRRPALINATKAAGKILRKEVVNSVTFRTADADRAIEFNMISLDEPIEGAVQTIREKWYWRFHEWGTVKMTARPFMRPGLDHGRDRAHREATLEFFETVRRGL